MRLAVGVLVASLVLPGAAPGGTATVPASGPEARAQATADLAGPRLAAADLAGAETKPGPDGRSLVAVELAFDPALPAPARATARAAARDRIVELGGHVVPRHASSEALDLLDAWLPAARSDALAAALAAIPGVVGLAPIRRPVLVDAPAPIRPLAVTTAGTGLASGADLLGATAWQAAGYTGSGLRIGIIDGGFSGLTDLPASTFPGGLEVRCYSEVGVSSSVRSACERSRIRHGTAVAETVASMAPDATLFLANPVSFADMLDSIAWMTSRGVRVINASFASGSVFEGPGDGTSPSSTSYYRAIDRATAGGALWVNAAGNSGDLGWFGPWASRDGDAWLDFTTDTNGDPVESDAIRVGSGATISFALRWSDRWGASANDLDLYLYRSGFSTPVAVSTRVQDGNDAPVERVSYTSPAGSTATYLLKVRHKAGGYPSRIELLGVSSGYVDALAIREAARTLPAPGDSANAGMVTVGAVDLASPETLEPWSSRGPTGDGRIRPDVVAPDCADTQTVPGFCGTSQAAPYASGAAALLLQADPTLGPSGLAAALRAHATPLASAAGEPVPNPSSGYGRIALGSAPAGPPPPPPAIPTLPGLGTAGLSLPFSASGWRALAVDGGGAVHLAYADGSNGGTVRYRRSLDGGALFAQPVALSTSGTAATTPAVAASGDLVVVAWREGDLAVSGTGALRVVARTSADRGATWGAPVTLSTSGGRAGRPAVAIGTGPDSSGGSGGPGGAIPPLVVVGWTDAATGKVLLARGDGSGAFRAAISAASTTLKPSAASSDRDGLPSLAVASGAIHLAWSSTSGRVAYRRSRDGGATWDFPKSLDSLAVASVRPWLAVAGSSVVVGYTSRAVSGGIGLVYLRRSGDGGSTFASRRLVATTSALASRDPVVATSGTTIRVAWAGCTTSTCSTLRLWYRQSTTGGTTWGSAVTLTSTGAARPLGIAATNRILLLYAASRSASSSAATVTLRIR